MAGFRAAMADLAETLRRVFQAPPAHAADLAWRLAEPGRIPPLVAEALAPFEPCAAEHRDLDPRLAAVPAQAVLAWAPAVGGEPGLQDWATDAKVCVPPLFRAEGCGRLEVPPLPRRAQPRRQAFGFSAPGVRGGLARWPAPAARRAPVDWTRPRAWAGLDRILGMPVAVAGEDLERLSKALWMRYTLQLVRATGQNIRNLEILGLYRVPARGTRQINHDAATGRLLMMLGPEAAGARRQPFLLARCKNDGSVVFCFVEES